MIETKMFKFSFPCNCSIFVEGNREMRGLELCEKHQYLGRRDYKVEFDELFSNLHFFVKGDPLFSPEELEKKMESFEEEGVNCFEIKNKEINFFVPTYL